MSFILENLGTILICLLIVFGIILAVRKLIQDKKNGKSRCGDNCNCCPHSGTCHKDTTL